MTRVQCSLTIARPVDEVFAILADQRNEPRYNPRMASVTKLSEGPIGAGTRFAQRYGSGARHCPSRSSSPASSSRPCSAAAAL